MSDQDLFNGEGDKPAPSDNENANQSQEPSTDPFADQLSGIKNEDGTPKYTDVASALDSIPHAQSHIQNLETDNAALTEQLGAANAAKELLAKQVKDTPPTSTPGLTADEVAAITRQTLSETEQANLADNNVDIVRNKFSELYGEKAKEVMAKVATDSGMSLDAVKALAATTPTAVFKLAGIDSSTVPLPKTPGQGQGDNFTPPRKPEPPKSIMGGSDTKSLVDNWKAAGEIVKQQNQ